MSAVTKDPQIHTDSYMYSVSSLKSSLDHARLYQGSKFQIFQEVVLGSRSGRHFLMVFMAGRPEVMWSCGRRTRRTLYNTYVLNVERYI